MTKVSLYLVLSVIVGVISCLTLTILIHFYFDYHHMPIGPVEDRVLFYGGLLVYALFVAISLRRRLRRWESK